MNIFESVEFYVIAAVAAAAVVGLCVKPAGKGEARQHLLAGELGPDADTPDTDGPAIDIEVADDGTVILTRRGLGGLVGPAGAVSLAVTVEGFDIKAEERLVAGNPAAEGEAPGEAVFRLGFLGREHYHLRYYSEALGSMAATPLHVRPGIRISKSLV